MSTRHVILLGSVAVLAALSGALAFRYLDQNRLPADTGLQMLSASSKEPGLAVEPEVVGVRRPDYTLGATSGQWVSASDFDGKVVLVNFWATWCGPCREEMPMLVELHQAHSGNDFQVVGIALDDVEQARDFAAELGVDYPILVGATDVMTAARLYGNRSGILPYSVLVDRSGVIRWAHLGVLEVKDLTQRIKVLLEQH